MLIPILSSILLSGPDTLVLSLDAARKRALETSPAVVAARSDARASNAARTAATRAFLPSVRAEVTGMRTTDPVAVFGLKLRQGGLVPADMAIDALNNPRSFGGITGAALLELPLIAPEGWYAYRAAGEAAEASDAVAARTAGGTAFTLDQAYFDAQLAERRVAALDQSLESLRAHARQADALHAQGLVTGLDARLAALRVAELEVKRLAAAAESDNIAAFLRMLLGVPEATVLLLTDSLHVATQSACAGPEAPCSTARRGDIRALDAGRSAAVQVRRSAKAARLPQLAAFAGVSRHTPAIGWTPGSGDWTVGVSLRWDLFPALSGVAAVRKASAEAEAAGARYEDALRMARLEVLSAERSLEAANQGAEVAARAEIEAREALAQAELRYRTGTSSITELLDVQSMATDAALTLLSARRDLLVAESALAFAYGVNDR